MLTSKLIKCPTDPDEMEKLIVPIVEMVIDYTIEIGIRDPIFDAKRFVEQWHLGNQHILGYYEGTELAGFMRGSIECGEFDNNKRLVISSVYLKPEHRKLGSSVLDETYAASTAYAKELGVDNVVIHTSPEFVDYLKAKGSTVLYVGMGV